MDIITTFNCIDCASLFGYLASFFVFCAFYMKTIIWLRVFGITSNICFIIYSILNHPILYPIFFLHIFLFPLNMARLLEIRKQIKIRF